MSQRNVKKQVSGRSFPAFGDGRDLAAASALSLLLFVSPAAAQLSLPAGLYVRADVGGAFEQDVTFRDTDPSAANCDLCGDLFPTSAGNSIFLGVGVGYRLNPMFRADLTVDYLTPAKVNGHSTGIAPSTASADLDSLVGLVNGYFDLASAFPDRFGRLQPYISPGICVPRNHPWITTVVSPLIRTITPTSPQPLNFPRAVGPRLGLAL